MGLLKGRSAAASGLGIALILQALIGAFAVFVVRDRGWDDGAITLAFARTFAEHGRIALTAASDPVEGFSSPTWFLVNAAAAVFRPGFAGAIALSQGFVTLCLMASSILLFLIGRRLALTDGVLAAVLIVFALSGPGLAEAANGMEMGLLAAAGLAFVYSVYVRPNPLGAALAGMLFLSTRFEAISYYGLLIAPLLLERRARKALVLAGFGMIVFALQTSGRVDLFGAFLPNTIFAKMHAPYAFPGVAALQSRLAAALELVTLTAPLALTALFLALTNPEDLRALAPQKRSLLILAAPIAAVELFALVTGKNQGYLGRMAFLGLPFALLLFGLLFDLFAKRLRPDMRRVLLTVAGAATVQIGLMTSVPTALAGLTSAADAMPVTPDAYRRTGMSIDRLRERLGLSRIVFLTPDVGGLGLCCEQIRVLDLGLLTSHPLALSGYGALPALIATERPDVIEAHRGWAQASDIYDLTLFKADYRAAMLDGLRVYLRADHAAWLLTHGQASWCPAQEPACLDMALQRHRYVLDATRTDDVAFLNNGGFVLLKPLNNRIS